MQKGPSLERAQGSPPSTPGTSPLLPPHCRSSSCAPPTAHMGVHRQPVEQESRTPQDSVVLSGGKLTGSAEAGSRQERWAELSAPAEHSGYSATRLIFTRDA